MKPLPNNLYTAAQTRELDQLAITSFDISGTVLMERAGAAAFELLRQRWPRAKTLCIICGTGNNGGDGYVVARLAHEQGLQVTVLQVGDSGKISGDALAALQRLEGGGVNPVQFEAAALAAADLVVDALFGTGLRGEVTGEAADAIAAVNDAGLPVLALDIPSGLLADTGDTPGRVVKATVTLSFIGLNQGLLTAKGPDCCGELCFNDLQLPPEVFERVPPSAQRLAPAFPLLPVRPREAHKGMYGHIVVAGGDIGMSGAARLAAEAALRCGAGRVSVATRYAHAAVMNVGRPEIMSHPAEREAEIRPLFEKADTLVVGPGLGQSEWAATLLAMAMTAARPLVMDADALNLLALEPMKRSDWILTPHPGEAARLLDCTVAEIQSDRFAAVRQLADRFGGTVVLKGNGTLVCHQQQIWLCDRGNPGMASGGMGDVLSGMIAALLAQGMRGVDAACKGVYLHAAAADMAVKSLGEHGLLASDLLPAARRILNSTTEV